MAATLAQDGKSVKVCVQEAMGAGVFQGLPLSLSGVKRCADGITNGIMKGFAACL